MISSIPPDGSSGVFTIPALLPPPGVKSNFTNPTSHANILVITSGLCLPIMILCVAVRFYTKLRIRHLWGWDDWACIPATMGTIGFTATALSTLGKGVGPHQWDVPFSDFTLSLLRKFVVLDMLYSPTILMAKLSLLLLYLQVFRPNVGLRYCIYFTMGFLSLFYSATFIAYAVLSIPKPGQSPLAAILSVDNPKDIPLGIAQGAVNVASDFYIFCLPIPVIWRLQLPASKKVGVLVIFATGLLACIASAFGLFYRVRKKRDSDVTWKLVFVLLLVVVELTVAVMCSCLTTFPGFFRYHLPFLRSLASLFGSSFKSLRLFKLQHQSTGANSPQRLATDDIKITLGSKVDGRGMFLNSLSLFGNNHLTVPISELNQKSLSSNCEPRGTRREHFEELAESHHPSFKHISSNGNHILLECDTGSNDADAEFGLSAQNTPSTKSVDAQPSQAVPRRQSRLASWRTPWRSNEVRTGHWKVLTLFRPGGARSSRLSGGSFPDDLEK